MELEQFPASESAKRMLGYVSLGFYERSYVGKWLLEVLGQEIDDAKARFDELPLQAFPETATWGLRYHEEKFGLPVREDLPEEERRKEILKKRDMRTSMTPYAMEQLLKNVTEFQVHVADINDISVYVPRMSHPNVFQVVLIGDGTAAIAKIRELLERVKQSHTVFRMFYYENSDYEVPLRYDNAVHFQTGFYPRYNLSYLHLDHVWALDNKRRLSGYDSEESLDFYPVQFRVQTEVKKEVQAELAGIRTVSGARENIGVESRLQIQSGVLQEIQSAEQAQIQTEAAELITTQSGMELTAEVTQDVRTEDRMQLWTEAGKGIQVEKRMQIQTEISCPVKTISYMTKMNQTDAEWKMDGSRKLDGGHYVL